MLNFFSKTKQLPGWLVIGLSEKVATIVHVERTESERPSVKYCEFQPITDVDSNILHELCKKAELGNYACICLLSVKEYSILQVEAPQVPSAELKSALRWQVKDLLGYPVEQATIDVLEIPSSSEMQQGSSVYAIAASNEVIRKRMGLFDEAKLKLEVIDIPEMAQRNLSALFEKPERVLATLSFNPDEDNCLITFTMNGTLYMTRRFEISSRQLMDVDEDVQDQYRERLILELQRSFDYFDRQNRSLSLDGLILMPFLGVMALQEYLTANLDVSVQIMNLNDVLDFSAVPELADDIESHERLSLLLGTALRTEQEIPA